MSNSAACSKCGAPLASPDTPCARCLLARAADSGKQPHLGPGFLDDLPMPDDKLVIADNYTVIATVARGGMGVVYKARQENLNRIVAVKMLLGGLHAGEEYKRRFLQEAKAAASLSHPNIVSIHDWGEDSGQPFFSMDFIDGQTLTELARERPLPPRAAAEMVRILAQAMHHAHAQGILHRDLKPSNVLVDAAGVPRITDFGLARDLNQQAALTSSGDFLGTPGYLPPEQVSTRREHVGPTSDVYGLGAVLYYLLTSRPPHPGDSMPQVLRSVLEEEPLSPRRLNPRVPVDLETICLKCLEKAPARRYDSAADLAADLGRWLEGIPIRARPVRPWERAGKWARRHPGVTLASSLAVLAGLLGLAATTWQWRRAEMRGRETQTNLYAADLFAAQQVWQEGDLGRALRLLSHHVPAAGKPDLRGVEWRCVWQACQGDHTAVLRGHSNHIHAVAFSPEGRHLVTGGQDGNLKIWDVTNRALVTNLHWPSDAVLSVAFAPDATQLALGTGRGPARVFSWPDLQPLLEVPAPYARVAFSPDGRQLAVGFGARTQLFGEGGGEAAVWDIAGRRRLHRFPGAGSRIAFSPDGRWLIIGTDTNGQFTVWDRTTEKVSHRLTQAGSVIQFAVSPDSRFVARASNQGSIRVWELATGREAATLSGHRLMAWGVVFTPDSRWLVSAGNDQTLRRWRTSDWEQDGIWRGHEDQIWALAISPDGATLATASKDETVRLWHASPPQDERLLMPRANSMVLIPRHDLMAAGSGSAATVELWDVRTRRRIRQFDGECFALAATPDGARLATATCQNQIHLWRLADGTLWREWARPARAGSITASAFAPSGTQLASGSPSGSIYFHATTNDIAEPPFAAHRDVILSLLYASDGQTLFVASRDTTGVTLWNPHTREKLATLRGDKGAVHALALSPDGRILAAGSADHRVKLWDWRARRELTTLSAHAAGVFGLAFSPDGLTLGSASEDRTIKFWHLPTGREVITLPVDSFARSVAFNQDGSLILTRQQNGPIRFWPAGPP